METQMADRPPRRRARMLAVAMAATALLAGCVPDPPAPPPSPEPSPTPTVEPVPEEPRYEPIDVEFCEQAALFELSDELGLVSREYFRTVSTDVEERRADQETVAVCQFFAGAYRPSKSHAWFGPLVVLELHSFPKVARAREVYEEVVVLYPPRPGRSRTTETIDGWWDEGASTEWEDVGESIGTRDTTVGLDIYLRHANLYLYLTITGAANEADVPEARRIADELAWLVVEETMRHVSQIEPG